MAYDSTKPEPADNTPVPAKLTLPDGRVIPMPAALSAEQVEALAYVATLFLGPLEATALGKSMGNYMRRTAMELVRQEIVQRESGTTPTDTTPEG